MDSRYSLAGKRVWVTGYHSIVGAALLGRLRTGDWELLTAARRELVLRRQHHVG